MTTQTGRNPRVIHSMPGRMRLDLGCQTCDGLHTEAKIRQIDGVRSVSASPITGNVLITYDAHAIGQRSLLERVSQICGHVPPAGAALRIKLPVRRAGSNRQSLECLQPSGRPRRTVRAARRSARPELLLKALSIVAGALSGGPLAILLAAIDLFLLLSDHGFIATSVTPSSTYLLN